MRKSDELIERYVYDVVRRVPEKQRKDIELELKTLIEDMIEERMESESDKAESRREECVKAVLTQMGDPVKLARSYRGEGNCLISGENYDSYCFVLKIVLVCVAIGICMSGIVSLFVQVWEADMMATLPSREMVDDILNIFSLPMALIQAFGVVTLIYAIMDRKQVKVLSGETAWTLEKLPQIPYKKAMIGKVDCVAGIVCGVLVAIILMTVPHLLGAWVLKDGIRVSIPIFNLSVWSQVLPIFMVCLIAGIVNESVKLAVGRYNHTVMIVSIVTNLINIMGTVIIFKLFPIWNLNFVPELRIALTKTDVAVKHIVFPTEQGALINNIIILLVLFGCLLDAGITIYRTMRYGENQMAVK